jgi:GNAT superfamily N-acetyltransferase
VTGVALPPGWRFEQLQRRHSRRDFASGQPKVDDWLASRALQQQGKHLSSTRVLLDPGGRIGGFYSLATGQVDFSDLLRELLRRLPRRQLPVAVLAWLGVAQAVQGQGHGRRLLAHALRD